MDLHPGENVLFEGHPSLRSSPGLVGGGLLVIAVAALVGALAGGTGAAVAAGVGAALLVALVAVAKRASTNYLITNERLVVRTGLLRREEQQTRLARIQSVSTKQSLGERLLRVGTVDFDTAEEAGGDDFAFRGVSNPRAIVARVDAAQREAARTS